MSRGSDFWSRRKARVEAEEQAEARATEAEAQAARDAALADKSDAELCEDLGLPDPNMMQSGDDFSAFMARAVPERLRRRALRRLWLSNPALANVDGLVDYGQDFTDSATVMETLTTAYQVGRGMTAHVEKMARQAEADALKAGDADPTTDDMASETTQAETTPTDDTAPDASDPHVWQDAVASDEIADLPPRRRMRFAFNADAGVDMNEVSA